MNNNIIFSLDCLTSENDKKEGGKVFITKLQFMSHSLMKTRERQETRETKQMTTTRTSQKEGRRLNTRRDSLGSCHVEEDNLNTSSCHQEMDRNEERHTK